MRHSRTQPTESHWHNWTFHICHLGYQCKQTSLVPNGMLLPSLRRSKLPRSVVDHFTSSKAKTRQTTIGFVKLNKEFLLSNSFEIICWIHLNRDFARERPQSKQRSVVSKGLFATGVSYGILSDGALRENLFWKTSFRIADSSRESARGRLVQLREKTSCSPVPWSSQRPNISKILKRAKTPRSLTRTATRCKIST